ncbi:hypothetical protein EIMP300_63040 [Escherichia coli]|uniref:Uncharacterized protein n=1 Tax=Escherichia coli TaxID=562 RepID=A0A8S0FVU4_ECOLX|nr:hypothetical protein EIMP300_63040 [Escherichia coli]
MRTEQLAIIGTLQLGDSSAYEVAQVQPVKLAAMEGEWQTEPAPAPFHVVAWPEQDQERNAFAIKIPALLGILATHSLDKPVPGLKNLMAETYPRLQRGRMAWLLMQEISQGNREPHVLQAFRELEGDLGYGMLLSRYAPDMNHVTAAQYQAAMRGAIPQVAPVFWSFRINGGLWFPAATGDADCACPDAAWQNRPASLGAENGALEFAAAVDCD